MIFIMNVQSMKMKIDDSYDDDDDDDGCLKE